MVGGDNVNVVVGIGGGSVGRHQVQRRKCYCCCWGNYWFVGVQLQRDVLAKKGEGPNRQVDLGVACWDEGDVQPIGTNISRSMLRVSSCLENHIGQ